MFTEATKIWFKKAGLFAPIPFILAFVSILFIEAQNYPMTWDDLFSIATLKSQGYWGAFMFYYERVNGRWFSHLFTLAAFFFASTKVSMYWIYILGMMLFYVCGQALFLRAFSKKYLIKPFSDSKSFYFSLCLTSFLFFFLIDGRFEIWYWLNSISMHQLSLTYLFFGLSALIRIKSKNSIHYNIIGFFSFIAIGGLNEVYALCTLALLSILFVQEKSSRKAKTRILVYFLVCLASLAVNVYSAGIAYRLNILPPFDFFQAFKNTMHSFIMPILDYQMLHLKILSVLALVYLVFSQREFCLFKQQTNRKLKTKTTIIAGLFIFSSYYLAALVLSDITPYRVQGFACVVFIYFVLYLFLKKNQKPQRYVSKF